MSNNVPPSYRGVVLTIGVIIITAAGAYLGAGIKTDNEIRQTYRQISQLTSEEQIKMLEMQKARLITSRTELERKVEELRQKRSQ